MLPLLRVTLDLFADFVPRAPVAPADTAINSVAPHAAPTPSADQSESPIPWQHPRATHGCTLAGQAVRYVLRRGPRRSIGMLVTASGLEVRAPRWVSQRSIDESLQDKAAWLVRQLQRQTLRCREAAWQRDAWTHGGRLPYLGGTLELHLDATLRRAALHETSDTALCQLQLPLAADSTCEQTREQAERWLRQQARAHLSARLDHFAPMLGVEWQRLRLSSARTRWGSASADGAISLNWRLIHLAPELVDYVVVHELCHLRVLDHSPRFWATVEAVQPDYRERRAALRQVGLLIDAEDAP